MSGAPQQDTGRAAALTLGALGVVFGDIGTSPLYAMQTVFSADNHAVKTTHADIYGVVSLVFWSIVIIVAIKYVTFVMRADNGGEGGIMALTALIQRVAHRRRVAHAGLLVALGVFGASLFYGDGMITPAISVLSAVEGLNVATPSLSHLVVPIALGVLTVLFGIQRWGTGAVGRLFGPVMLLWFTVLGIAGAAEVVQRPGIVRALSPSYAVAFFVDHFGIAFVALGSVVLAVTGAEALYADMGHFGRGAIRRSWFFAVFPALTLNYLGQAALISHSPSAIKSPFYLLVPDWAQLPMVLLATVAVVIASQSVISGTFSVTRQVIQLGFLPRLGIRHTSKREAGQIYVPGVNWLLFVAVIALVLGFGSSARLAFAYGFGLTGTFLLDTALFLAVARLRWKAPWWKIVAGALGFGTLELAFFAANLTKIFHGAWLPLVVGVTIFTLLETWQSGRAIVTRNRTDEEGPLKAFVEKLHAGEEEVRRVPGTAIFLNPTKETTPLAMRANVEHNRVLHEHVVILSIDTKRVPYVPQDERVAIDDLGHSDDGIVHVTTRFGYAEEQNVPAALRYACERELSEELIGLSLLDATYFVSRISIVRTDAPGLARWRKRLFVAIAKNAASPVDYFGLPIDRTITMGSAIGV